MANDIPSPATLRSYERAARVLGEHPWGRAVGVTLMDLLEGYRDPSDPIRQFEEDLLRTVTAEFKKGPHPLHCWTAGDPAANVPTVYPPTQAQRDRAAKALGYALAARCLNPEDLGWSVPAAARDLARVAVGLQPCEVRR